MTRRNSYGCGVGGFVGRVEQVERAVMVDALALHSARVMQAKTYLVDQ